MYDRRTNPGRNDKLRIVIVIRRPKIIATVLVLGTQLVSGDRILRATEIHVRARGASRRPGG